MKVISRVKLLAEKYGGKWKFRYPCEWWCDDNNRLVARVASFGSKPTEREF